MNTTLWMVAKTKNILSLVSRLGSHQNNFDDISRSNILTTSLCSFLRVHCVLIGWFVSYEINAVLWLVTRRSEILSTLCSAIKMSTEPTFTAPLFLSGWSFPQMYIKFLFTVTLYLPYEFSLCWHVQFLIWSTILFPSFTEVLVPTFEPQ